MTGETGRKRISIVIPVYNESANLRPLHRRLDEALSAIAYDCEMLFVDDGSIDGTFEILQGLAEADPRVRALQLSRNFGQQAAITAGLEHAVGDAILTMDGDLQHPPELIAELLKKWEEGYEVVYTIREESRDVGALKAATSAAFYRVFSRIADFELPGGTADFRLLDRSVREAVLEMQERTRFLRGMIHWTGFRRFAVRYRADPRHAGRTKYSARRMLHLAMDAVTSFSPAPLRVASLVGVVTAVMALFYLVFVLYSAIVKGNVVAGWASVLAVLLILGGTQLVAIGILGEYVYKIYIETKRRPHYFVRRRI